DAAAPGSQPPGRAYRRVRGGQAKRARDLAGRHRARAAGAGANRSATPGRPGGRGGETPAADRRAVQGKKAEVRLYTRGARRKRMASYAEFHRRSIQRSEEHTSELQSRVDLVCRLLLEKK